MEKSYNILITEGDIKKIKKRSMYEAHLWIHDGVVKKKSHSRRVFF